MYVCMYVGIMYARNMYDFTCVSARTRAQTVTDVYFDVYQYVYVYMRMYIFMYVCMCVHVYLVTNRPENVIGMHFMNPVPVMKLVELIRGLRTYVCVCMYV